MPATGRPARKPSPGTRPPGAPARKRKPRKSTTAGPAAVVDGAVQVVAVTGVRRFWGAQVLEELEKDPRVRKIVGLDTSRPDGRFKKAVFHSLENRDPRMVEVFASEGVQAVCHLDFVESYFPDDEVFDRNVLGSMFLLSAAANAGVKRVVIKSLAQIYGARPDNPNFLDEGMALRPMRSSQYIRDWREVEKHAANFQRQHPDMLVSTMRYAGILGPHCLTLMTQYLSGTAVPALAGFDPPFQVVHEADVTASLVAALFSPVRGPINVAADPILPLSTMISGVGQTRLPLPGLTALALVDTLRRKRLARLFPLPGEYLKYQCVMDTRRMKEELGFFPRYSADDVLRVFARRLKEVRKEHT